MLETLRYIPDAVINSDSFTLIRMPELINVSTVRTYLFMSVKLGKYLPAGNIVMHIDIIHM